MRGTWAGLAREVLLDARSRGRGIIDVAAAERLIDSHAAGRVRGGDAIWALLNFELWARTFIDGDGVQTLPASPSRAQTAGAEHLERRTA